MIASRPDGSARKNPKLRAAPPAARAARRSAPAPRSAWCARCRPRAAAHRVEAATPSPAVGEADEARTIRLDEHGVDGTQPHPGQPRGGEGQGGGVADQPAEKPERRRGRARSPVGGAAGSRGTAAARGPARSRTQEVHPVVIVPPRPNRLLLRSTGTRRSPRATSPSSGPARTRSASARPSGSTTPSARAPPLRRRAGPRRGTRPRSGRPGRRRGSTASPRAWP